MAKGSLTVRIIGDATSFQRALGSASGMVGKFAKVAAAGIAAAAAAVAGFALFSIKKFADFDAAMTNSTAIMGDLSDTMRKDMSDAAREVAKTTKFSAEQAAESYFFLASAGLDAAESISALPKVAKFAQAGNFDMARATDLLTDAQSALGLVVDDSAQSLKNMGRVSDVLVKANTIANASVEQFSESLTQKAGAALRALNKDVEEGVAVLAVFADQGVKGSEAGVQLNAVLDKMTVTARTHKGAYEKLGVAVFDSSGEMRNMADIVGDLEVATKDMTVEQKLAAIASLGLTRQARDGIVQLLGSSDAIRDYEKALRDAGGTTDDVAQKQMQTFWAKLGIVKDQIGDVALSVGMTLMPALEGFAAWLTAKLPAITGWFDRVSGKFMEMLGVSEEVTDGAKGHVREFSQVWDDEASLAAKRAFDLANDTGLAYAEMGVAGDDLTNSIGQSYEDMIAAGENWREKTDEEFTEAGDFMQKLLDAWKIIWEKEVEPWFIKTAIPFITDTFAPALGRAVGEAAKAAVLGVLSYINNSYRDMNRQIGGEIGLPKPSKPGRPFTGHSVPALADGGIVSKPTLALIGEAGPEAVIPLGRGGGTGDTSITHTYNIEINNPVPEPASTSTSREMRKLAVAGVFE